MSPRFAGPLTLVPPSNDFTTASQNTDWPTAPKEQAAQRLSILLSSGGHENSYMGVALSGFDFITGTFSVASVYDASPIIVYRKPATADPTLERDAVNAAAPFTVAFQDSVLDSSEQWYLGHRIDTDRSYWQSQGVLFRTALEPDGTITVFAEDTARVVGLLEQHYGYDGRVFVGRQTADVSVASPINPRMAAAGQ